MYLDSPAKPVGEKRMAFRDLDWDGFKQIQQLLTERTRTRFTYDTGVLGITIPLESHERSARLIERFILILVVEMGSKMKPMGSTTLDREDLLKSAEPDNGYYIQNYGLVADHEVDLTADPPPDLVVEVDITHTNIDKNTLHASMGVPEFWRFNGKVWKIFCLQKGSYIEQEYSPAFPFIEKRDLYSFLETALLDEVAAGIDFRRWVQSQL